MPRYSSLDLGVEPNRFSRWLRVEFISNRYVYLDRWSIVHLASGILIGIAYRALGWPGPALTLVLLILYELLEWATANVLFRAEKLPDKVWDVIVGMVGYGLAQMF